MKPLVLAALVLSITTPLGAQERCAASPIPSFTVLFFERWEDAIAKIVANNAYRDSAALLPIRSATKNGYVVMFEKWLNFTNDCPPQQIEQAELSTEGWNRIVLDSPAAAEDFVELLNRGTPVAVTSLHVGYAAGTEPGTGTNGRRRAAPHEIGFAPRGMVVVWYDPTAN